MNLIIETIISTISKDNKINFAPIGVEFNGTDIIIRSYKKSDTYNNLLGTKEGVINITDNIYYFTLATLFDPQLPVTKAKKVTGYYLKNCCHYYEIKIKEAEEQKQICKLYGQIIYHQNLSNFTGFNRARNVILEILVMYTRLGIKYTVSDLKLFLDEKKELIQKTAGKYELKSLDLLTEVICNGGVKD